MKTVKLYRFKLVGPAAMELVGEYNTRSAARFDMADKANWHPEYKYAIYDGSLFLSSTR